MFRPCFKPPGDNFRISLRDRVLPPRTDESAPSPGSSSSAKCSDLAAGPKCSARAAPRYREVFVTMSSRRIFEVLVAPQKDRNGWWIEFHYETSDPLLGQRKNLVYVARHVAGQVFFPGRRIRLLSDLPSIRYVWVGAVSASVAPVPHLVR